MNHTKVLGITIPSTLQWNCHIPGVIKKANKQMFFLILLKRAKVMTCDFISFYHTCSIRVLCTLKFIPPCIACVFKQRLRGHSEACAVNNISRPSICWQPHIVQHEFSYGQTHWTMQQFIWISRTLYLILHISCTISYHQRMIAGIIFETVWVYST